MRPKRPWPLQSKIAEIFTGALYQFSTVGKWTEVTVGLKTTSLSGPSRTKFLTALLAVPNCKNIMLRLKSGIYATHTAAQFTAIKILPLHVKKNYKRNLPIFSCLSFLFFFKTWTDLWLNHRLRLCVLIVSVHFFSRNQTETTQSFLTL